MIAEYRKLTKKLFLDGQKELKKLFTIIEKLTKLRCSDVQDMVEFEEKFGNNKILSEQERIISEKIKRKQK